MTDHGPNESERISKEIGALRKHRVRKAPDCGIASELQRLANQYERQSAGLGGLAEHWQALAPEDAQRVATLKAFARGVLTIAVPDASARFLLDRALRSGLRRDLIRASKSPLRDIKVVVESRPRSTQM